MLLYKDYENKIGLRFDIVNGDLVESETGQFVVSDQYLENTIYLNKLTKTAALITPQYSYVGNFYQLRLNDCTSLWTRWLDEHKSSHYYDIYKSMSHRDFHAWMKAGMCSYFETQPFEKITDYNLLQEGDCLVYSYDGVVNSHVGIYLPQDRILHHLARKYSCIDNLDKSKILGAYRYA